MNNILLYARAHVCNNVSAATKLAQANPSEKNIKFIEKLLDKRMTVLNKFAENRTLNPENVISKYWAKQVGRHMFQLNTLKSISNLRENNINDLSTPSIDKYYLKPRITDFSNKHLENLVFVGKDLRMCNFDNAISSFQHSPNFSYSNLSNVDLTRVKGILDKVNFSQADLSGAKIDIFRADYSNAILDNTEINLQLPHLWDERQLDLYLNDINNKRTLFHTLHTIDDKYTDLKVNLMRQIVTSLRNNDVDHSSFPRMSLINNIAAKDFYLEDEQIKTFVEKLVSNEIIQFNETPIKKNIPPATLSTMMKVIANSNDPYTHMITNNGSFIQLIVLGVNHNEPQIQQQAKALYEKYLEMEQIKPLAQLDDFGNGEGKPDWLDKNSPNYILFNDNKAMLIDNENITNMLNTDLTGIKEIKWDLFYLYHNNECVSTGEIDYAELFSKNFKIFNDNYQYYLNKSTFSNTLLALELGDYHKQFKSVLSGKPVAANHKLVNSQDQIKLGEIFNKVLTRPHDSAKETSLTAEHYSKLVDIFQMKKAHAGAQARVLLTLSAIFSKYSSSAVFGTESESPQVLRDYAFALMSKAHELDPNVTYGKFYDWKDKLLGLNGAFTCTAVLSSSMIKHCKDYFNPISAKIVPPIWA